MNIICSHLNYHWNSYFYFEQVENKICFQLYAIFFMNRDTQTIAQWVAEEIKMPVFGVAILVKKEFFSSQENNKDLPLKATNCDDRLGK